jgi:integrase
LPREEGNPFVFVGDRPMRCLHPRSLFGLLRDLRPGLTVHGFRSSFSDWAHEEAYSEEYIIEASLAHIAGKVKRAYHRGDAFQKRQALMEAWSAYCCGETEAANVVQFNKAG